MYQITTDQNIPFNIRLVYEGDHYGLNDCLTHDKLDPLVEFYDRRYPHTPRGQFVSRYYLSTLNARDKRDCLNLEGSVKDWTIDKETMWLVHGFLDSQ